MLLCLLNKFLFIAVKRVCQQPQEPDARSSFAVQPAMKRSVRIQREMGEGLTPPPRKTHLLKKSETAGNGPVRSKNM